MAAGVAVGPATRAYRENYQPSVAVGTQTRAYGEGWRSAATPYVPPAGAYNPLRDIEAAEGKRGSEQALSSDARQRTNAEGEYGTQISLLNQREADQKRQQGEVLANLARSYQQLGVRQGEGANKAGVLNGGALIAAAQKRARNEGVTKGADEARFGEQHQANDATRGRLSVALEQLLGTGGSLTESAENTRTNQQGFENSLRTLENREAAEAGLGYQQPPLNTGARVLSHAKTKPAPKRRR